MEQERRVGRAERATECETGTNGGDSMDPRGARRGACCQPTAVGQGVGDVDAGGMKAHAAPAHPNRVQGWYPLLLAGTKGCTWYVR